MRHITAEVFTPLSLSTQTQEAMYGLMDRHYDCIRRDRFDADLMAKNSVLVLRNRSGALAGFSTLSHWIDEFEGEKRLILYSGDTIIDRPFWGSTVFSAAWLRLVAAVRARHPALPAFWLLIVKGHRTYRHLPVFARVYYPSHKGPTPPGVQRLMDHLAFEKFGADYAPGSGIVKFPSSRGHLREEFARPDDSDRDRPEVAFFMKRNPGYTNGDELVCLTSLAAENMRPFARRIFESAFRA